MKADLIDVSTAVGVSGWFMRLDRVGELEYVSALGVKEKELMINVREVERLLRAFNDHRAVSEFGVWCLTRRKNFTSEFVKMNKRLEERKAFLQGKLRAIDEQLAQLTKHEAPENQWTASTEPMTSLVPRVIRKSDQGITERNEVIDQNLGKPTLMICTLLNQHFSRDGVVPPGILPQSWREKYHVRNFVDAYRDPRCRNCVEKMISLRRRRARYLKN